MNTTGKEGYWPIVQGLRPGLNDGEEPFALPSLHQKALLPLVHAVVSQMPVIFFVGVVDNESDGIVLRELL